MEEAERLNILLTHWIEHNESHIKSYRQWASRLKDGKLDEVALKIEEAANIILTANKRIEEAKEILKDILIKKKDV